MAEKRTPEDNRIIQLYLDRSEEAVRETQRLYGAYLHAIASGVLRDYQDAEECVNDTYLRAWESIPKAEPDNLKAYLSRVVRNLSISRLRSNQAKKRGGDKTFTSYEELSECIPGAGDVIDEIIENELSGLIRKFVHSLPDLERAIFVRRYFFLDSVKAVANRYGMSEGSVMTRLSRTRKKLRTLIEKEMN